MGVLYAQESAAVGWDPRQHDNESEFLLLFVLAIALFVYWRLFTLLMKRLARSIGWTSLRRWLPALMLGFAWLTVLVNRTADDWISRVFIVLCSFINLPIVVVAVILNIHPELSWRMVIIASSGLWLVWYETIYFIESRAAETIKTLWATDEHR